MSEVTIRKERKRMRGRMGERRGREAREKKGGRGDRPGSRQGAGCSVEYNEEKHIEETGGGGEGGEEMGERRLRRR